MYKKGDTCPFCGAGNICEKLVEEHFSYKGHSLAVPDYRILDRCPESLGVLPGVTRSRAVGVISSGSVLSISSISG